MTQVLVENNFQLNVNDFEDYLLTLLNLVKSSKSCPITTDALWIAQSLYHQFGFELDVNSELFQTQRVLVKVEWSISTDELLAWLESDDSKERIFAAYVLAQRKLDQAMLNKIKVLRNDPDNRPWIKMAALQCLVEIEREK